MRVMGERHIQKAKSYFSTKITSELQYGLHFAKVATRRDPQSGRCTRSTTKNAHTQMERAINCKKIDIIYLIRYLSLIQARDVVGYKAKAVSDVTKKIVYAQ